MWTMLHPNLTIPSDTPWSFLSVRIHFNPKIVKKSMPKFLFYSHVSWLGVCGQKRSSVSMMVSLSVLWYVEEKWMNIYKHKVHMMEKIKIKNKVQMILNTGWLLLSEISRRLIAVASEMCSCITWAPAERSYRQKIVKLHHFSLS